MFSMGFFNGVDDVGFDGVDMGFIVFFSMFFMYLFFTYSYMRYM